MPKNDTLEELRDDIDSVDDQLLALLNTRAALTIKVGQVKRLESADVEFYRPEREAAIIQRLVEKNKGPLPDDYLVALMRSVIAGCLSLEEVLTIAYLGPPGTFTHAAMKKHFGRHVREKAVVNIEEVFRAVESADCAYGVVPIENSVGGSVNQTLDCLRDSPLQICGEVILGVKHQLLARNNNSEKIVKIYAHEQAFQQCQSWLKKNYPNVEKIAMSSNAAAAKLAYAEIDTAAIASVEAAEIYELEIIRKDIEDDPRNTTRFVVLGSRMPGTTGEDRTIIVFSAVNEPGVLHKILGALSKRKISMTRIESRPLRDAQWDYLFFVEIAGHSTQEHVEEALVEIKSGSTFFKLLGSFPCALG